MLNAQLFEVIENEINLAIINDTVIILRIFNAISLYHLHRMTKQKQDILFNAEKYILTAKMFIFPSVPKMRLIYLMSLRNLEQISYIDINHFYLLIYTFMCPYNDKSSSHKTYII